MAKFFSICNCHYSQLSLWSHKVCLIYITKVCRNKAYSRLAISQLLTSKTCCGHCVTLTHKTNAGTTSKPYVVQ